MLPTVERPRVMPTPVEVGPRRRREFKPYSIRRPEASADAHHESGNKESWTMINNYLGERESYASDSPVTMYIQDRLNFLTGDDHHTPQVVVVHDDEVNAFAIPGFVVVHDGLLKRLEFQEEVDALLSHEGLHITHDHVHEAPNQSMMKRLGSRRAHETEADIVGAMEVMDRKGVNAAGQISLLQKLLVHQEEQEAAEKAATRKKRGKAKGEVKVGDIEHGSLLDRILNLDEAFWLMDVRNLSNDPLTPLRIDQDVFEEYQRDEELLDIYDTLDPITKRQLIQRQIRKLDSEDGAAVDKDFLRGSLNSLMIEFNPGISTEAAEDLAEYTFAVFRPTQDPTEDEKQVGRSPRLKQLPRFRDIGNPERVKQIAKNLLDPVLPSLGISKERVVETVDETLKLHLALQPDLDVTAYRNLIKDIGSETRINFSITAAIALTEFAVRSGAINDNEKYDDIIKFIAETDVSIGSVAVFLKEGTKGRDKTKERFIRSIAEVRAERARSINDPIELFAYIKRFGSQEIVENWVEGKSTIYQPGRDISKYESSFGNVEPDLYKAFNALNPVARKLTPQLVIEAVAVQNGHHGPIDEKFIKKAYIYLDDKQDRNRNLHEHFTLLALHSTSESDFMTGLNRYFREHYTKRQRKELSTSFFQTVNTAAREAVTTAKELGYAEAFEVAHIALSRGAEMKKSVLTSYFNEAEKTGDNSVLVELMEGFSIGRLIEIAGEFNNPEHRRLKKQWETFAKKALAHESVLTDNQALLELVALGLMSDNVHVNMQVPAQAMEQIVKNLTFEEGVHLVFERFKHLDGHVFRQAIDHLIEEKARTPEQFAVLNEYLKSNLKNFLGGDELIGKLSLADGLIVDNYAGIKSSERSEGLKRDLIEGLQPARLLRAMLDSGNDERELKEYMFERWWLRYRTNLGRGDISDVEEKFRIEDLVYWYYPHKEKENKLLAWTNELPQQGTYVPLADVGDEVYRASEPMKYYALRKLLTGEHGVLGKPEERDRLLEGIIDTWITFGENHQAEQIFRNVLSSLFRVADERELYHQINPILLDLILHPPTEPHSYAELAHKRAGMEIDRMVDQGILRRSNLRPKRTGDSKVPDDQDFLARKIRRLLTGGKNYQEEGHRDTTIDQLLEIFPRTGPELRDQQFTPTDAFFLFAENIGAVGTRMLQQLGLYKPDLAAEDRQRFMDVFDKVKGQSRLQAYRTLLREAEISPEIAHLMDHAVEIRPRIGGGSLVTVFEFVLDDGSKEAVGVKNPNTEYHVENMVKLFDKTLTEVLIQDPGNRDFLLMQAILYDTHDWIMRELSDPKFEEKDARFRELNDSRLGNFENGNNRYGVLIPEHKPTGTRWVRRDEFIEGTNLTSLRVTENETNIMAGEISQADFKSAVSLINLNNLHQLSTGLVHSDIHPGQFRITADNANVAIFDRYNLLELDEAQQGLIGSFMESFTSGSIEQALSQTVDYLFALEKNNGIRDMKETVHEEVRTALESADSETASIDTIIALKQRGIYIPLEITLIAKNLLVMNKMAKDAGFSGIAESILANYQ